LDEEGKSEVRVKECCRFHFGAETLNLKNVWQAKDLQARSGHPMRHGLPLLFC
jgi:hypothetical protein